MTMDPSRETLHGPGDVGATLKALETAKRVYPGRTGAAVASTIANMLGMTPVVQASFGLFLIPISLEFHWPRASVSGVFGVLAIVMALSYPVAGRLADRFGARRIIIFGNLTFGASVAALAFGGVNIWFFYGLYALVGLAGSMPSTMMLTQVISGWFDEARGAMLGIVSGLGNGVGATLMPLVALMLMQHFGWRGAYLGLGAIVVVVGFPVLFFMLRDPPFSKPSEHPATQGRASAETSPGLTLRQAMGLPVFWLTLGAIGLGAGCMTAVFTHVVPIMADHKVSSALGTEVVSVFAIVCAGWQICVGVLLDKVRSPKIVAPFYIVSVIGLTLLQHAVSQVGLIGAGALLGIGMGTEYGALPFLISRYFGLRHYGAIAGVMYGAVVLAQGVTPYLMDASFDAQGSYRMAILVIQGALVAGAAVMATLRPYTSVALLGGENVDAVAAVAGG